MLRYVGTCQYEIRANLNYEMDTATNYEAVRFDVKKNSVQFSWANRTRTSVWIDPCILLARLVVEMEGYIQSIPYIRGSSENLTGIPRRSCSDTPSKVDWQFLKRPYSLTYYGSFWKCLQISSGDKQNAPYTITYCGVFHNVHWACSEAFFIYALLTRDLWRHFLQNAFK